MIKALCSVLLCTALLACGSGSGSDSDSGSGSTPISNTAIVTAVTAAGLPGTTREWDMAEHLLDQPDTLVAEAGRIRFIDHNGVTVSSILVILTETSAEFPVGQYVHDYRICQSVHQFRLTEMNMAKIEEGYFNVLTMKKPGIEESEISFIARLHDNSAQIDSKVYGFNYPQGPGNQVYNFQVLSANPADAELVVSGLVRALENGFSVTYANTDPIPNPDVYVSRYTARDDTVILRLEHTNLVDEVEINAVVWAYPNPTPTVRTWTEDLGGNRSSIRLNLDSILPGATDAEISLLGPDRLFDRVFVSFNPYGVYTSNWHPFQDTSSDFALLRVSEAPMPRKIPEGEIALNGSVLSLQGDLDSTTSFAGVFVDLFPQFSERVNLGNRPILSLWQKSGNAGQEFEMSVEFLDNTIVRMPFTSSVTWSQVIIDVRSLAEEQGLSWAILADSVTRVVISRSGQTGPFLLDIADLSLAQS